MIWQNNSGGNYDGYLVYDYLSGGIPDRHSLAVDQVSLTDIGFRLIVIIRMRNMALGLTARFS
jgi:hypothetical protein